MQAAVRRPESVLFQTRCWIPSWLTEALDNCFARALKILILKPSSLGDVVQALPVLRLLKRHLPQSEIYWWIDSTLRSLLEGDADLNGLFLFERWRWASPRHWDELLASIRQMRAMKFDWAIDLQSLARSGLFAWLA
ncbi:MAG: hypothetical protein DME22_01800, partial [Verrucomicrobia bacterium]